MSSGPGLSHSIPNNYVGPSTNIVPIRTFPHIPTTSNYKFPVGQLAILGKNPSTGSEGDLWYLAKIVSNVADWRKMAGSNGAVTGLKDQVGDEVEPDDNGFIQLEGLAVANGANASGIPLETVAGSNSMDFQIQVATALGSAPADKNDAGICSFDSTAFSVSSNGFVTLSGGSGPAIDSVNVDFNTPPGTDPVVPSGAGAITITGAPIQWGQNPNFPIATRSNAANSITIEVQASNSRADVPTDMLDAGICSFDSDAFEVDANGFVQLIGDGVPFVDISVDTHTPPGTDPVVPDGSGLLELTGGQAAPATIANVIQTTSLAENSITIQIQQTSTAAAKDTTLNGVAHFNSAHFSADQGFIDISTTFGKFLWLEVAVNTSMAVNTGYILNDGASHNLLLPSTAAQGDMVKVIRKGAGGCVITQGASQVIHYNTAATTVGAGGTLTSSNQWDAITLVCVTANTTWVATDSSGMWTTA